VAKISGTGSRAFDGRLEVIPVDSVVEPKGVLRRVVDEARLAELRESIRVHGVLVPITVAESGDRYELVCGLRRLRAVRELGLAEIPAVVVEKSGSWRAWAMLTENRIREAVNPVDEAVWFSEQVKSTAASQHEVARSLGVSPEYLSQRLGILRWPGEVRSALGEGLIAFAVGRELAAIADEQWRAQALRSAVFGGCSARQAAEWRRAAAREVSSVAEQSCALRSSVVGGSESLSQRSGVLGGGARSASAACRRFSGPTKAEFRSGNIFLG